MRASISLFAALVALASALPTETSYSGSALAARDKAQAKPTFIVKNFRQHVSPKLNSISFNVSDPTHSHSTGCEIKGSKDSVYKNDFTGCYPGGGKNEKGVKFGFKVSKTQLKLQVQWREG